MTQTHIYIYSALIQLTTTKCVMDTYVLVDFQYLLMWCWDMYDSQWELLWINHCSYDIDKIMAMYQVCANGIFWVFIRIPIKRCKSIRIVHFSHWLVKPRLGVLHKSYLKSRVVTSLGWETGSGGTGSSAQARIVLHNKGHGRIVQSRQLLCPFQIYYYWYVIVRYNIENNMS
jgi:hypothetical protein